MTKCIYVLCLSIFLASGVGLVQGVLAAPEPPPDIPGIGNKIPDGPQSGTDLFHLFQTLTNWLFVAFILAAVVFIIIAAFQFLTGGGNPQAVAEARQKLIWAFVAIGLAVLSRAIPVVINFIITAPAPVP